MDCHSCKHSASIPGDCHLKCIHPETKHIWDVELSDFLSLIGKQVTFAYPVDSMDIKLNDHGYKNGWANWPFNYDPIWLDNCNKFESK